MSSTGRPDSTLASIADAVENDLRSTSAFSSDTISFYVGRLRGGSLDDGKMIDLVKQAVKHLSEPDQYDASGPLPADLASVIEIWQEKDRQSLESLAQSTSFNSVTKGSLGSAGDGSAGAVLDREAALGTLEGLRRLLQRAKPTTSRQHYTTIPSPYLPSTLALRDLEVVPLSKLEIYRHNRGKVVLIQALNRLFRGQSRAIGAVADRAGNAMFIELTCTDHEIEALCSETPQAAWLAVKEPLVTSGRDVPFVIRVDHPTDLIRLSTDARLPASLRSSREQTTASEWKGRGNALFKKRLLADAAAAYKDGLASISDNEDTVALDLHRNLAQVYLSLGSLERAKAHAESAINETGVVAPAQNVKAYFRAASATYALQDFSSTRDALQKMLKLAPQDENGRKELLKVYKRLNEAQHGSYDFDEILTATSAQRPNVDAASFTKQTLVKTSIGKGNGLFAAEDLNIGDLVLCEKAFAAAFGQACGDGSSEILRTYDSKTEIFSAIPASLWQQTLQKAVRNPSTATKLLGLGGNHVGLGSRDVTVDGTRVIDSFQIHDIVARNSFGIPTPSPSAKTDQWGVYTSQSGTNGGTNLAPRNSAIFCHAAFINHSCLPNVEKRFIGDLIVVRAARPIAKGEEILLDYAPGEFEDVGSREKSFKRTWQFACDCRLCQAESKDADALLDRRISLAAEANDLSEKLSRALPASSRWDAVISKLEELVRDLQAAYGSERYRSIPLKQTTFALTTLALLYGARKDYKRHVEAISEAFESLGWVSPLETGGKLAPKPQSETVLDLNIPQLLYMACSAASMTGDGQLAQSIKKLEPKVYLALNGTMNGFKSIDERRQ